MENIIEGKIATQNGIFLLKVSNKKIKRGYAYIINQEDVDTTDILYFEKKHNFEIIGLNNCNHGFQNLHIILHTDMFNLIGTNGNVEDLKTLLKYNYIPCLVKLIK